MNRTHRPAPAVRVAAIALALLGVTACSTKLSDLERPLFQLNREDGLCGGNTVVDAKRGVYTEGGCEGSSGYQFAHETTPEKLERVKLAFEALPEEQPQDAGCVEVDPQTRKVTMLKRITTEREQSWTACVTSISGVYEAPYEEAVRSMEAL